MRPINPHMGEMSTRGGGNSSFMLVGRADVAELINPKASPGCDVRAEQSSPDSPTTAFQKGSRALEAVYVDFDLHTLQIMTASFSYHCALGD